MKKEKNTDRTQITVNAPHVRYDVKALPQYLIIRDKQIPEENFERKCWEQFLNFHERNLSKFEQVHGFQKKNASNELNICFLNKIEEDFLQ